jgi:transcriptional regulator with XRE-family HTH domain
MGDFHKRLKKLRMLKGFSQEYMADKLNIATVNYGKIERGYTAMTMSRLTDIANVLGVTIQFLLNENLEISIDQSVSSESQDKSLNGGGPLIEEIVILKRRISELEEQLADKRKLTMYYEDRLKYFGFYEMYRDQIFMENKDISAADLYKAVSERMSKENRLKSYAYSGSGRIPLLSREEIEEIQKKEEPS